MARLFDDVMIIDKRPEIRDNRLRLLNCLLKSFEQVRIGDISKILF